jgi:ABC-type transporter Mla maintaining outer membrane lipid asymmetry ATPase subunit MlaF
LTAYSLSFSRRSGCDQMDSQTHDTVISVRDLVVGFGDQIVLDRLSYRLRNSLNRKFLGGYER